MEMEHHSTDQEHRQIPERHAQAQGSNASSSPATSCNTIRRAAEYMTGLGPREACGRLRSLTPLFLRGSPSGLGPPPTTRVHHVWPGKNVFFLDGRVICGPDPRGLILTAMAILVSEWIFLWYVVDPLSSVHPAVVSAASLVLLATVTASFAMAATRDPGIIPRNNNPAELSPSSVEDGTAGSARTAPPSRFLVVNGVEVRLKFCQTCKIHRPPRSHHCAVCDNCVDKFDQHCPWISQCVGLRNYRFYLLLLCSAFAFYAFILTFSVIRIRAKSLDAANAEVFSYLVTTLPETFALAALSFMAVCVLACLLASHAFLVVKNKTSHERYKGQYRSSPNPYDKGVVGNIKECLFGKLPPPRVDFRAAAAEAELNFGSTVQPSAGARGNNDDGELNFDSSM